MRLASRWCWFATSVMVIVIGGLAVGVILSGCSPAPDQESDAPDPDATAPSPDLPAADASTEPDSTAPEPEPAGPPAAPNVSTFAPAKDLVSQVAYYLERLDEAVASEQDYNDSLEKISKDANTLIVVALALGLHDEANQHKAAAPTLMKSAQDLAATKDFASAKAAVETVKATAASQEPAPVELKWEKVADLPELMKQVPLINTRLKRLVKGSRFKSKAEETTGSSAVIAAIAQGTIADTGATNGPEQIQQWYGFSTQMRDAAAAVNVGIHALDEEATAAAMQDLAQSCDDCHAVFHIEEEE